MQKKYRISIFILIFIVGCFWAMFQMDTEVSAQTSDYAKAKRIILTAYRNFEMSADISSCHIYNTAKAGRKVSAMMEDVLNETPELFYAGRKFSKDILSGNNQIVRIQLSYAAAYKTKGQVNVSKIKAMQKKIAAQTQKAMKKIKAGMTQLDKAMVLHDYLALQVSYTDKSSAKYRLTQEGALVRHKANCQGYAVTYAALLQQAGIKAKCITSADMNHMWNLVKIGSKWYHVDVTWDDATSDLTGKKSKDSVRHTNFMLSNAAIRKTGHYGFTAPKKTSRKYDNKYWKKVVTAFQYRNKMFRYRQNGRWYQRKHIHTGIIKRQ